MDLKFLRRCERKGLSYCNVVNFRLHSVILRKVFRSTWPYNLEYYTLFSLGIVK